MKILPEKLRKLQTLFLLTMVLVKGIIQSIQLKSMKKPTDNKRLKKMKGWLILLLIFTWIFCSFDVWSEGDSVNHEHCGIEQYWSYFDDGGVYNSKGDTFEPLEIGGNIDEEIPC